jgi:thymidylate kinase
MLIEIDGPSGAGKTTLVGQLERELSAARYQVHNAADEERTSNDVAWRAGELMRGLTAEGKAIDQVEAVFLFAARAAARARIAASLDQGPVVVLCDRLRLSLEVQARLARMDQSTTRLIVNMAVRWLCPDLVVMLDVSHAEHVRRLHERGHTPQDPTLFRITRDHFAAAYDACTGPRLHVDTTDLSPDVVFHMITVTSPLRELLK